MKTTCFQHFLKHFSFAKFSYRFEKKLQRRRKSRLRHRRRSSSICWMSRWCMKRTLFFKFLYLVNSIQYQLRTTKKLFISSVIKWTWRKKLENLQMQKSLHVIWSMSRQRWCEISLNQMKKTSLCWIILFNSFMTFFCIVSSMTKRIWLSIFYTNLLVRLRKKFRRISSLLSLKKWRRLSSSCRKNWKNVFIVMLRRAMTRKYSSKSIDGWEFGFY